MKTLSSTVLIVAMCTTLAFSQELTQTVRGTIKDTDSRTPLIGVNIIIVGSDPVMGTVTDKNGKFRLEDVPIGRHSLQLTYLGYETKTIPNIVVNSGKEIVLELSMKESFHKMEEVVVKANKKKGAATNEMALLSARSISVDETSRYTGGMNDPSRVVANLAGVAATPDGSSDIIVRGNSPKYMQWRLDGIEITSPYHFDDQNASYGALTALNNSLLTTSDFFTGAFAPEYGNVLSSVFDVNLRNGNNEKFEATAGVGILGTDVTLEGPFKKGYGGSYLINYRYSTVSMIQELGLIDVDGVLSFQDMTFKVVLPTKKSGTFSIFGLGGLNGFKVEDQRAGNNVTSPGRDYDANVSKDYEKSAYLGNVGIKHLLSISDKSYLKTTVSYSANGFSDDVFKSQIIDILNNNEEPIGDSLANRTPSFESNVANATYRGSITYNHKINTKHKIQLGSKYDLTGYNYDQYIFDHQDSVLSNVTDFEKYASTISNFISWKYRINENVTLVSGLHNLNVLLNNKSTLEPRIGINWKLNNTTSIHAGYGKHSTMEKIQHYYTKVEQSDGSVTQPNTDLDLLKANHFVIGFEKRITSNLTAKVEAYYQHLYDLPVENNDTSLYATINEGIYYRYVDLVNEGTGKNYGVEITLERFFNDGYYYLVNASLFNSTYKALDGVERNTQYNGNYMTNLLVGKEFTEIGKKGNKTLALNAKVFYGGGKKYIPLLRNERGEVNVDPENNRYLDYSKAYEDDLDDIFSLNFSVSYKINRAQSTHEIFLDLMNLTNHQARLSEYYDKSEPDNVGYNKQIFFFPNLMYRVYF